MCRICTKLHLMVNMFLLPLVIIYSWGKILPLFIEYDFGLNGVHGYSSLNAVATIDYCEGGTTPRKKENEINF